MSACLSSRHPAIEDRPDAPTRSEANADAAIDARYAARHPQPFLGWDAIADDLTAAVAEGERIRAASHPMDDGRDDDLEGEAGA